jgi:hypothetical protein
MNAAHHTRVSPQQLRELLSYNPLTGVALWRVRLESHFDNVATCARWNTRYAGKIAGGVDKATGYIRISVDNKHYALHRVIWAIMTGEWPPEVDHEDTDKLNNKWTNLRKATHSQNSANRVRQPNNTSGFKGVSWSASADKWRAYIVIEKKQIHLGNFDDINDAKNAYKTAAKQKFGKFARTT